MLFEKPLFSLYREKIEEIRVSGDLIVFHGNELIYEHSEATGHYPCRSLLKPFQWLACGFKTLKVEDLPALGSISATEAQVKELRSMHAHFDLSKLKVSPSYPMDELYRNQLKIKSEKPNAIYHPCFSKHAAILRACVFQGWPQENYTSEEHPFHQRLLSNLKIYLESNIKVLSVRDGCTLPSPVLSLKEVAILYQKLISFEIVRDAMIKNPFWIGGPGRLDTELMELNPGKVIAKEGADGLFGLSILPSKKFPKGCGIALKLSSGFEPKYFSAALKPILDMFGLVSRDEKLKDHHIQYHVLSRKKETLIDLSPVLSSRTAVFPGDKKFQRTVSLDMKKGHHLSLSSMETTLHIGSHVDSPSHFSQGGKSMEQVPLESYLGPCQIISVQKERGTLIEVSDIANQKLLTKRILFKTGSFPDLEKYNENFVALSPELIHFLGKNGVILVGVDTPSIDPSLSKELPAHHATLTYSMAILEGISMTHVSEGLFELMAFPLNLEGGDGSPVRAILRSL